MELQERIIQAAGEVMRLRGLAGTTTKEIARAAECAEGSLYKHFASKDELYLAVMGQMLTAFAARITELPKQIGSGSVQANLETVLQAALAYFHESMAISASVFAEPDLLVQLRERALKNRTGPRKPNEIVTVYLHAEQLLGRVHPDADPEALSYLLLGACFQRAFHLQFLGEPISAEADALFIKQLMRNLIDGILPPAP